MNKDKKFSSSTDTRRTSNEPQSLMDSGKSKFKAENKNSMIGRRTPRATMLTEKYALFDSITDKMREHPSHGKGKEDKGSDQEIRTWWNDVLSGMEPVSGDGDEEGQQPTEQMERWREMSADEINRMAEQFIQFLDEEEEEESNMDSKPEANHEEEEEESNMDSIPEANLVSARHVTVVHVDDDDGGDNVRRDNVVTGLLVVDFNRKALREPIFDSIPCVTPLRIMITGLFLLVVMAVSLTVSLTYTGGTTSTSSLASWTRVGIDVDINVEKSREFVGESVTLSERGDELWVGGKGVLRFFVLSDDDWRLRQDLSSDVASWVSVAVALYGSAFIVGDPNHARATGRVMVYRRSLNDGAEWEQRGQLLKGNISGDWYGRSVDINNDGSIFVVGSNGKDSVCMYRYRNEATSSNPTFVKEFQGNSTSDFGRSVAMSADSTRLIVGAPLAGIKGLSMVGAAYIYSLNPQFSLLQSLDGDKAQDYFGESVDVSSNGDLLAVGAWGGDYVRIYSKADNSMYSELFQLRGQSLSVSADGTRLAVGVPNDEENGKFSGRVFVYAVDHNTTIREFGGDATGDYFGSSVSLSRNGTRVSIGTRWTETGGQATGLVRVYESS